MRARRALALCALLALAGCAGAARGSGGTFHHDGLGVSVRAPSGWYATRGDDKLTLTNFRLADAPRGKVLADGRYKIEIGGGPLAGATASVASFLEETCVENSNPNQPLVRVLECRTVEIGGRSWAWVLTFEKAEIALKYLQAFTVEGGRVYNAVALLGEDEGGDGRRVVEGILKTLRIDGARS